MFKSIFKIIKKYFFAGVLSFLPIGVTCYAIIFVTTKLNQWIVMITPKTYLKYASGDVWGWFYKILVLLIVLSFFCFLGILVHLYVGRKFIEMSDFFMKKIPFFNKFYNLMKKITTMIFDKKSHFFNKVVRIEFPQKGTYAIAFLTRSAHSIFVKSDQKYVHVFLPTSPNPMTGFFLMVPEDCIEDLDLNLEEAMKLVISCGALC